MAKKGASGVNGRDSQSKRLGTKAFAGEQVKGGAIIVRQRGTHMHPGDNVGKGGDDTLFAKVSGKVTVHSSKGRRIVSVVPEQN
jgi:large subunit ribosomal protein L27